MGVLRRAYEKVGKGLFGVQFGIPGVDSWESTRRWEYALDLPGFNPHSLQDPYAQHPVVAAALELIASDAASVPLEAFRVDSNGVPSDEPEDNHPLLKAFDKPGDGLTQDTFWQLLYLHYLLHGEFFMYYPDLVLAMPGASERARRMAEDRARIRVLYPPSVYHKLSEDGELMWKLDLGQGKYESLEAERLTQHRRINPSNPIRGLSKLASINTELQGDYAASSWNRDFFGDQNGMPGGLLRPGAGQFMGDDQRKDTLRTWNQRHGSKRSIGILPPGWEFQDLGQSQKDMDFRGLREYARELALSVFSVTPFQAGVLDKANYANARKQEEVYWQAVRRMVEGALSTLNHDMLPKLGIRDVQLYAKWESVEALLEDLGEKLDAATRMQSLGVPLSVINERLDLGIDTDEIGDRPFDSRLIQRAFFEVPLIRRDEMRQAIGLPPVGGEDGNEYLVLPSPWDTEGEVGDEPEDIDDAQLRRWAGRAPAANDSAREERRALVWRALTDRTRDLEAVMERRVRSFFKSIEKEALKNADGLRGWVVQRGDAENIPPMFDEKEAEEKLEKIVTGLMRQAARRGGEAVVVETGLGYSFNLNSPEMISRLGMLLRRSKKIIPTAQQQIREALAELFIDDKPFNLDDVRDAIRSAVGESIGRARTIARTEVGAAFTAGRIESMQQGGIKRHEWLSSRDPDVRDSHAQLDGRVTDIGAPFPGSDLRYPKDPAGAASEVINCRCESIPVIEED